MKNINISPQKYISLQSEKNLLYLYDKLCTSQRYNVTCLQVYKNDNFKTCSVNILFSDEVFDEMACACDLKTNVYPPCGKKPYDENMPLLRGCSIWNVGANNNYFDGDIGEYNSGSGDGSGEGSGDSSGDGSGNGSGIDLDFSIIFGRKWNY